MFVLELEMPFVYTPVESENLHYLRYTIVGSGYAAMIYVP